ncbi:MAG TPA: hypothetical protein VMI12_14560 [Puia sp.]|nr:hypothetical protein [Puia sp.]
MFFLRSYIIILICFFSVSATAQTSKAQKAKKHPFSFYAGFGPNIYFNNLVIAKNKVNEFNYSFVGRFMWEPEHFLSLGLETGYNRLYTVSVSSATEGNAHIINTAIPIQIVVSMKFLQRCYFNFSMGQSIILNHATSSNSGDFSATSWSFADIGAALGYRHHLKNRFSIGAETKFFYSTHLNDKNLALVFMAGYNF